jgi:hypothetical protein
MAIPAYAAHVRTALTLRQKPNVISEGRERERERKREREREREREIEREWKKRGQTPDQLRMEG